MRPRVIINPNAFPRLRTMNQALAISDGDYRGPVLTVIGQVHRKQELRIFATQGTAGASGAWPKLSPAYAKRKRKAGFGSRILVRTGAMKATLTQAGGPGYHQSFQRVGALAVFLLGGFSRIAGYHRRGTPPLPRREMLQKTQAQIAEIRRALFEWYKLRVAQVLRHQRAR